MSKSLQRLCLEARELLLPLDIAELPLTALYHAPGFVADARKWDIDVFDKN